MKAPAVCRCGVARFVAALLLVLSLAGLACFAQQPGAGPSPDNNPVRLLLVSPAPVGADAVTALFAQVAVGAGYTTVFTLLNTGGIDLGGRLILTTKDGSPMNVAFSMPPGEPVTASSIDITPIHPGGTRFITAGPVNPDDSMTTGWARVESSGGTLGGVGTFQFTQAGRLVTIAGVLAGDAMDVATIPVDNNDALKRYTGYAIANPSDHDINVKIVVVHVDGAPLQTLSPPELNPLRARQQISKFLHQDVASLLTFQGSIVLIGQDGSQFSVVALVLDQGLITAVPVIPSKAPGLGD
jgi:hypothetical protein